MDVFIAFSFVFVCIGLVITVVYKICRFVITAVLKICRFCGCCPVSGEERAAAERRDALMLEYALAQRSPAAAPPPPPELELGYFPYSTEGRRASEKLVCAICLEAFEHGENCSEVPACRHLFRRECIGVWMKTNNATCLLCRHDIETGSEQLSAVDDMV